MHDHNADAENTQARIDFVLEHIRRVLRKYPANTLPDSFKWATWSYPTVWYRLSGEYVKLLIDPVFVRNSIETRIPLALLNAPEQDIHVWTRGQYWADVHRRRAEERALRASNIKKLEAAVERAQRELDAARA